MDKGIDISSLSGRYLVRRLSRDDLADILALCGKNELYYQYCPPYVTEESILRDMEALPAGKALSDKYYLGYFEGERLIAVLDLIAAYPDDATAFLGFFMTDRSVQNAGIGTGIVSELCEALKRAGFASVRLGWVKGSPQAEHFWRKCGFAETGAVYDTERYTVVVARRDL